jgi:hypothetical protein
MKHAFAALVAALFISLSPCRTEPVRTANDRPPPNAAQDCPQETPPGCVAATGRP